MRDLILDEKRSCIATQIRSDVYMMRLDRILCQVGERLGLYLIYVYINKQSPISFGINFLLLLKRKSKRASGWNQGKDYEKEGCD